MRTPVVRLAAAAASVLLGLTLAGCGADPSVAAYVGGVRISQSEVDAGTAAVNQALQGNQPIAATEIVNALIHGQIADQVAAAKSITITDGERDQVVAQRGLDPLLTIPAAKAIAYDAATESIVAQKLGTQAYLAELVKADVTLNPRYGTLDAQSKLIEDGSSGSLSKPLSTPAP